MGTSTKKGSRKSTGAPSSVDEMVAGLPIPIRDVVRDVQKVIRAELPAAEAHLYGGAKVRLILYSIGDAANVICGISPCLDEGCLLYLHHVEAGDSEVLEIAGRGKHAKHVRLPELTRATRAEVRRLLGLAASRAGKAKTSGER
jgi:hypothetical protein